ncbi:transketolase C-terminal domain-containing protein [Luteococcus sediminum]|uniref:alpha-ketoacid dehydrogenase subunit beta n=1 Tax=Luteococcus sp. TaxID=1969402 RepID=UPI0037367F50
MTAITPTNGATLASGINAALASLMDADPQVVLLGQDIGELGGVFRVTSGLTQRFGAARVRNSILSEAAIVGQAIGMSLAGMRPICEIQFDGFTYPAASQIITQATRMAQRWEGRADANVVIRIPSGAGTRAVEHHSECNEALFARVAGLAVACPSTGQDYEEVLRHAVATGGPTVIYEPIRLYHRTRVEAREDNPRSSATAARVVRTGSDLTVACYGAITNDVLRAACEVADRVSVEVVDLRWLSPLDMATVAESIRKTGALLVVHESSMEYGIGAEVAASAAEMCFPDLRGAPHRLAPPSVAYPPADKADDYLLSVRSIIDAIEEMTR